MNALRSAQRAYDGQTPPDPPHDYTEDMSEAEFMAYLLRWYVTQPDAVRSEVIGQVNQWVAAELSENFP